MKAEVFLKAQAMLGEGPLWDDRRGCLFFVDIEGRKLNRVTMEGEMTSYPMPSRIGTVGLTQSGRLIVALEDGLHFFDPAARKTAATTANPIPRAIYGWARCRWCRIRSADCIALRRTARPAA